MELLKLELKILIKINLNKSSQCIRIKNMRNFSKTYFNWKIDIEKLSKTGKKE